MRIDQFVPRTAVALLLACALVIAVGCGAAAGAATPGSDGTVSRTDAAGTVWLCRPGLADDPCTGDLATTSVPATGPRTVTTPTPAVASAFDWAPMYRQRTAASLAKGLGNDPAADGVAYRSVLAAWQDYLAHFNDGRPVVFIGHSQGAAMLIRLLAGQVDRSRTLRARMVSAIIAGGNVTVPVGREVGATFQHLPLCASVGQTSCVIAYSTFPDRPPKDSYFGRPGQGVSLQSGQTTRVGVQVACTNPAALAGGTADLDPRFLTVTMPPPAPAVATPWVAYPGLYSAACRSERGATWLQVTDVAGAGDSRPVVTETLGPTWGYHLEDVNLALGDLVVDVALEEQAYTAAHG